MSVGNAIIGVEEQVYISAESTFGVFVAPVATDAIRIIKSGLTATQERVNRKDKRNSRSISGRITRKKVAEFALSMYMLPSGAVGTPPDVHYALKAAFGTYSNDDNTTPGADDGSGDTYTLARDINESYCISRILGTKLAETFVGCVFNEIKIKFAGEDEVMLDIAGFAKEWIRTTDDVLNGIVAAADTTFTVSELNHIEVGSVVKLGDDDNGGDGYIVTALDATGLIATTSSIAVGAADGAAVVPFFPDAVTAGDPLGCFPGSITLDGIAMCFSDFEVTLNNNLKMRNECFGSESAVSYSASTFREVTFTGTLYMDDTNDNLPQLSEGFQTLAIVVTAGSTAGRICTLTLPKAELNLVQYEIPEEEEVTFSIEGQGIAPDAAEEELVLVFT